jgi:hypothetical protein
MLAIDTVEQPKAVIFTYTVSQAGPTTIEQRHVIYRSGSEVRDETLAVDGETLVRKLVRFSHREDSYAIARLSPRTTDYELLFVRTVKDGRHLDYEYDAAPLLRTADASIDRVTIDGIRYLPRTIYFTTQGPDAKGSARVAFAPFGRYWMPVAADVDAVVNGKPPGAITPFRNHCRRRRLYPQNRSPAPRFRRFESCRASSTRTSPD